MRIAPRLIVALMCGSMLAGCAGTGSDVAKMMGGDNSAGRAKKEAAATDKSVPTDLEGGIRQAQGMRLAGHYDDAIHVLSQLMLVAADDPRVVAEYGKTLAEKGRAQDAVAFLGRAIELSSNDWTLYSALGVSYDQLSNQTAARSAYEHALALRPEEPSVLNNYALSRMLAGDTIGARQLIGRAQLAGGASDAKIASNIALLNKLAPVQAMAVAAHPVQPAMAANAPVLPHAMPVQQRPLAQSMPRTIVPSMPASQPQLAANNGVVMQAVPFDPLAGPVKGAASHAPRRLSTPAPVAAAEAQQASNDKPASAKAVTAAPKQATASAKPALAAPVKTADAKPTVTLDIKAGAVKPLPVKAADKDAIPALRMSANSF